MDIPNMGNTVTENIPALLSQSKLLLSLALGLGLSASSGFRVFVPLLVASIASKLGIIHLGESFQWMGSTMAIVAFATATAFEIAGYYIPFVDNVLDIITMPVSIIAGTLLTASVLTPDLDPMLKWGLGIIVGGGSAGIVQAGTALTRATSTATTGGIGNPIVATAEHGLSLVGSILSILMPFVIAIIICLVLFIFLFFIIRYFKKEIYYIT